MIFKGCHMKTRIFWTPRRMRPSRYNHAFPFNSLMFEPLPLNSFKQYLKVYSKKSTKEKCSSQKGGNFHRGKRELESLWPAKPAFHWQSVCNTGSRQICRPLRQKLAANWTSCLMVTKPAPPKFIHCQLGVWRGGVPLFLTGESGLSLGVKCGFIVLLKQMKY